jgi:hypothetical protein
MMYSALRDLLTLASCLLTPVAGRKQPAGVEAFGKATSGFLLFWAAMVVGRGQGAALAARRRENAISQYWPRRIKAIPKHVLFVSTKKHYYLDYTSSKNLLK